MRKHSDSFPLWLVGAAAALTYIFSTFYQDALKASVLKYLTEWFGPAAANMLSGLTEIAPAVGAAILIVWLLYRYMDREFQRELSETLRSTQQLLATNQETSPLVRAMLEEKVSSQIEVMKRQREIAESHPDVRVADCPAVIALFEGPERDKLIPLLEAEKITAWGRRGRGEQPPTKILGTLWATHYLLYVPKTREGMQNQTFVRPKGGYESTFFDVLLNTKQIERVWPGVTELPAIEIVFDETNPRRRFWSLETWQRGTPHQVTGWEYRVEVRNNTNKTLYDVTAVTENCGALGELQSTLKFHRTGQTSVSIHPKSSELVALFLAPEPVRQPGMLTGPSAEAYGPMIVKISARDTPEVTRKFNLDPFRTPMIFD